MLIYGTYYPATGLPQQCQGVQRCGRVWVFVYLLTQLLVVTLVPAEVWEERRNIIQVGGRRSESDGEIHGPASAQNTSDIGARDWQVPSDPRVCW